MKVDKPDRAIDNMSYKKDKEDKQKDNGIMMAGSDDDEKVRSGVSGFAEDMIRVFIPLWICLPLTSFYRTGKAVSKAFD